MPGGPTMKIMGLAGLCREVKGLESLGVGHSGGDGLARVVERWHAGILPRKFRRPLQLSISPRSAKARL
jgi:hypothetical protein